MTKRVFISFTILFTVVVCTALDCKKWTLNGEVMSSVSVNINNQPYYGKELYQPIGGQSAYLDAEHRNDSSFFRFHLPRLYNNENGHDVSFVLYIIETIDTQRPLNGKTYEFKKGLKLNFTNERQEQSLYDWMMTDNCLWFNSLGEEEGENAMILDGYLTYHEYRIPGEPDDVSLNCDFNAEIGLNNGERLILSEGKIYFNRIYKNPDLFHY